MSEIAAPARKKGGWPKGKPRVATPAAVKAAADRAEAGPKWTMKARPNWEDESVFTGAGDDSVDRLKIAPEIIEALDRDGMSLQWVTRSVRGAEMPQETAKYLKGGWTPVHQSDFGGMLDGMFMSKGVDDVICVEDCMLVARPKAIHERAKLKMERDALAPMRIKEQELGHGIPNVAGSNHRSVHNSIKKSIERVDIPE